MISSYVRLKRMGRLLKGLCPFHSEKTASFTVYPEDQHFYCFGCGKGGDIITFTMLIENLEYVEAVKLLAQRAGLPVPEDSEDDGTARLKTRVYEINRSAARFFHEQLMGDTGKMARSYLVERGLSKKTVRGFGLGYSPNSWDTLTNYLRSQGFSQSDLLASTIVNKGKSNSVYDTFRGRVMFPIMDLRGNVVGFGGRAMGDTKGPKYLNSADTPVFKKSNNLYALNFAKASGSDHLLLAEGYMDVIALHQAGFTNSVAGLGTALTQEQVRLIGRYAKKVTLCYDGDTAGQNAARKAINLFAQIDMPVTVLDLKDAKDPDEYIQKFGATRFQTLIDSGKSALTFEIDKLRACHDLNSPEGKSAFLTEFCRLMADIGSDLQRDVYISEIARELDVGKERLLSTTESIRKRRKGAAKKRESHNLRAYVQDNSADDRRSAPPTEDLGVLVAEGNLLAMLMQNPDYYDDIRSKITEDDFTRPEHAAIFRALSILLEQRKVPEPIHMSAHLDTLQMGVLSGLMAKGQEVTFLREQADEYIHAIRAKKLNKSPSELGAMTPEELQQYILSERAGKN